MKRISGILSENRALQIAAVCYDREVIGNGWMSGSRINLNHIQRYFAIEHAGKIVSFLAYERYNPPKQLTIVGAWTHPDFRRQGLYQSLFDELVSTYKALRYHAIYSGFHRDNVASREMQKKQGRWIKKSTERYPDHHKTIFYLDEERYA
jgi:L-amino acid N-acyltransferase YncA